jgi:hypothetical protein
MKKDSILEQALLQAKALEEAVKTNAKGILQSTMKEEISQLVKESLEQEVAEQAAAPFGSDEDDSEETEVEDVPASDESNDVADDESEDSIEEPEVDDTEVDADIEGADDESELDADMDFGAADDESEDEPFDLTNASDDEILQIFKKMGEEDGIIVQQNDDNTVNLNVNDEEFLIKLNEDEEEETEIEEQDEFGGVEDSFGDEEPIYEIEFDDESDFGDISLGGDEFGGDSLDVSIGDDTFNDELNLDDIDAIGGGDDFSLDGEDEFGGEGFGDDIEISIDDTELSDEPVMSHDMTDQLSASELDEEDEFAPEGEMEEIARTIGLGNRPGSLTQKGARAHKNNPAIQKEHAALRKEVALLREKNEEYKKALNVFRDKLQEVAVFNANLAYATRLFTEHSTTKHEKLEVLKRFDKVATLKESQGLYQTLKGEFKNKTTVSESVAEKIVKTPTNSSSKAILAESKAYQSPQFSRMQELMSKLGGKK